MEPFPNLVNLMIDGRPVAVTEGTTILETALAAGIDIPRLCHHPRLRPMGGCRLCIVDVEGIRGLQTSCCLEAAEGMEVRTSTPEIRRLRKTTLELIIAEHRMACATCDTDGSCELQDAAYRLGVNESAHPPMQLEIRTPNYTSRDKAIAYDPSKCIRCGRCIRACDEIQGARVLTMAGRGAGSLVTTPFHDDPETTACETCGQCIDICPTGAMAARAGLRRGRKKDLQAVTTTCVYCGVGCQLILQADRKTNELVRVEASPEVPNHGSACVKGKFGLDFLGRSDRLSTPLIRKGGELQPAGWEEAIALVARRFSEIRSESGPDSLAVLSSAKTTNEDNYLMQKFARAVLGTNNVDHCARLCHASTVAGLARAFGSGAMTNSIHELRDAPVVFVIGSNTTECHPVIGSLLRQGARESGTRLIVADPRRISLAGDAEIHLQHRPGTDVALINGMIHVILEEALEDRRFITGRCDGFDRFRDSVSGFTPEIAAGITGVPADDIRRAARIYAGAQAASIVYSMGITQHACGTDNVLSLANLAMVTGNVGKLHSGVNPLRGQNNVQGACDMGALPDVFPGYQKAADPEVRRRFSEAWQAELSDETGLTVVEMMLAAEAGNVRGMYIMGENPMLSDPDVNHVASGLENLDFLVVQDIFLSETAELADVVLPAAAFAEREGTFTNTERRVQKIRRALDPPGEARPDWRIIAAISGAMGRTMDYRDVWSVTDEIAGLTPIYSGIIPSRLDGTGLQWPCPDREHPGTPILHGNGFARGQGLFHPVEFLPPRELPDSDFPFILTTGRMLQHWHTGTLTRRSRVLHHLEPDAFIEIHPHDARDAGVAEGDLLDVRSRRGRITVPARITDRVFSGCVFLTFHFRESPANALTIAALDPVARIPEFKACAVSIRPARPVRPGTSSE